MVRRVGFGETDKPPSKKRDNDRPAPAAPTGGGKRTTRLIVGAFLVVWLTVWSGGIAYSVTEIMDQGLGAADFGLFIWVAVALIFWVLAANALWRVLTGRPLSTRTSERSPNPRQRGHGLDRGDWDHGSHD